MFKTMYGPQGGTVTLDGRKVINLASNNYLGLANHPDIVLAAKEAIDTYGVGAGAGRTIVGNYLAHDRLEAKLAEFKGVEASCAFNSGLAANIGLIPLLAGEGDAIFSDELNHASIIDGIRLSRAAVHVYRHLDMASLEERLESCGAPNKLIITDGVFSMDGDLAPLPAITRLARRYGAKVMVDDAHGDGVMGPDGRGTVEHFAARGDVYVETGSFSKAFGSAGGFVAGPAALIERVKQQARSFVFTATPMQPCMAAAALRALEILEQSGELVEKLWENREYLVSGLVGMGFDVGSTKTPIIPIMVGDEDKAQGMTDELFNRGIFAQAIQFPIVPRKKARLRVIVSAGHSRAELDTALAAFEKIGKDTQMIRRSV